MSRFLAAAPKFTITALIILAMINLLIGVVLRYFVGAITDWLDVDPVPFTWVEEVGELSLAWLTLIGAAIGIRSRSHFTLAVFVHRLAKTGPIELQIVLGADLLQQLRWKTVRGVQIGRFLAGDDRAAFVLHAVEQAIDEAAAFVLNIGRALDERRVKVAAPVARGRNGVLGEQTVQQRLDRLVGPILVRPHR